MTDTAAAKFCPSCLSPRVTVGDVQADCLQCAWSGSALALVSVDFSHELGGSEGITKALTTDLRNSMAKAWALDLGRFLAKWGFLPDLSNKEQLVRYLAAAARGTLLAIIEERDKIEKEKAHVSG